MLRDPLDILQSSKLSQLIKLLLDIATGCSEVVLKSYEPGGL